MLPRSAVLLSICCLGLVGCANLQNKLGRTAPGTAATSMPPVNSAISNTPPPPPLNLNEGDLLLPAIGPESINAGEMPPPPPPPVDHYSDAKKDAPVSRSVSKSAVPSKLYNLDSPANRTAKKAVASKPANKTLQKLSGKPSAAEEAPTVQASAPAPVPAPQAEAASVAEQPAGDTSTLAKLARSTAEREGQTAEEPAANPLPAPEPVESATQPTPRSAEATPSEGFDTGFLAQPVRKGASADSPAKEPQSSLTPTKKEDKSAIRPVSSPGYDEPLDTERFS